jgi:hypothetical protein
VFLDKNWTMDNVQKHNMFFTINVKISVLIVTATEEYRVSVFENEPMKEKKKEEN